MGNVAVANARYNGTPLIRPPSGHRNLVVLTGKGQIMVQNAFKLHSVTCIPLIRYKSTFLQLINNLTTAIQCN